MTVVVGKEELHRLVDELPESELPAAQRFLRYLNEMARDPVLRALMEAPIDDEPLTEGEAARIRLGEEAADRGDVVSDEELRRELGI